MKIRPVENTYQDMLSQFPCTLKEASEDVNKSSTDKYMTLSKTPVVNFDAFKDYFIKNMALEEIPSSCDALYMTPHNDLFMIEFKNGKIEVLKNYEIKVKIYESLLIFSEKFTTTTEFTRNNLTFILVYNEDVKHGQKQYNNNTELKKIKDTLSNFAQVPIIHFGLGRFKKLYFKEVYTYSKAEFESEFVKKYCI
jgi:hypothetical protein